MLKILFFSVLTVNLMKNMLLSGKETSKEITNEYSSPKNKLLASKPSTFLDL